MSEFLTRWQVLHRNAIVLYLLVIWSNISTLSLSYNILCFHMLFLNTLVLLLVLSIY